MKKKYLVCPGPMQSKKGGRFRQISAKVLIRSYKVSRKECHVYINGKDKFNNFPQDLLLLIPRRDPADYVLEKCITISQMLHDLQATILAGQKFNGGVQ